MTATHRIAWLSPYGPGSDIGAFTRCLLPHFASRDGSEFTCDLFINENGPSYDSPVPAMTIPKGGGIGEILSRYQSTVFNLGNNARNHGEVAEVLRRVPGIAILHDFSYHHFFADECFVDDPSPPAYARLIREYYGSTGFNMALRSGIITREATLYAPWDGENVADYPLMQPLATLASAVVVHSQFMERMVSPFFKGPVLRLFLPSDQKTAPSPADIERWVAQTGAKETCQFTTFGHIGRAKCLDSIIQAFAHSPLLKSKAQLTIAGYPTDREYAREIEEMVTRLGLTKQVTLAYSVTNEHLLRIKNETDVFLNLRYPNTEGASGSLVEMMNAGRPTIAYRAGCYAELPDDAAVLIDRTDGVDSLVEAMEGLLGSADRRISIGLAARKHVQDLDSAKYAASLQTFVIENRDLLERRARFIAPVREARSWRKSDVGADDAEWFADLTRARRCLLLLQRDREVLSPEPFLEWPMDDLIALVSRVLLHASGPGRLASLLVDYAQRLGRWKFYRLISTVRLYQSLCLEKEISKSKMSTFGGRISDVAFWEVASQLQPEIFARLLYCGVLERPWGGNEPDNWAARIRQGLLPASALIEFLGSAEYRRNFPDREMAEVADWARREVALSAGQRVIKRPQIVWPTNTAVQFNMDTPVTESLLGDLWHRRDAQGRWSNGRTGDLRFLIPETAANADTHLTLRVRVAGTRFTGPRVVVAHCNRRELASLTLPNDLPTEWKIPLPASIESGEGINLLLVVDQDFSPASRGQSGDRRSLGIMLIEGRLTILEASPDPAAEIVATKRTRVQRPTS